MISGVSGLAATGAAGPSHMVSGASSYAAAASLYAQADTTGAGAINQTQLNQLLSSSSFSGPTSKSGEKLRPPVDASSIFDQLQQNESGDVTQQDFISGVGKLIKSWSGTSASTGVAAPTKSLTESLQSLQRLNSVGSSSVPGSLDLYA